MPPRKRRSSERFRSLYLWHRYAGLVAAVLVAWLAATGLLLNHAQDMDLAGRYVRQDWLLSLYNIEAPGNLQGQLVNGRWVAQGGDRVYLDDRAIDEGKLVGAAVTGFGFVIAFRDRLALYAADGERIEEIPFTASAAHITGVRNTAEGLVISTVEGGFLADAELTHFTPLPEPVATQAAGMQPLPPELAERIARDVLHHSLNWERVLLDLHAGRIMGASGIVLADVAGMLLLLLAVSGVIVWMQRRRR